MSQATFDPIATPPRPENSASRSLLERDAEVVWHGFTQMAAYRDNAPIVVDAAEGRELIDVDGRRYFDAISSLWVITLGHRVPELDEALLDQLGKVAHSTMLGNTSRPVVELAEDLAAVVPVDGPHFLFASDGSSAIEQALKIALQFQVNEGVSQRKGFLALGEAYHGDTVGSLSLGDGGFGTEIFDPLRFPVLRTPGYADPSWADRAIAALDTHGDELAALVLEPLVQAASGMKIGLPSDLSRVALAAERRGVLLIADEVATGFGRTGRLFACDHAGITPDLLCLGKGITGGYLPMSVTVASDRVFGAFLGEDLSERTFFHGHSYGGNALAAAVARAHLAVLRRPEVLDHVERVATHLAEGLADRVRGHPAVADVRQLGLLIGIELGGTDAATRARQVARSAVAEGVLLRSLGSVIPIVPPLTTTEPEADRIVEVLRAALDSLVVSERAH